MIIPGAILILAPAERLRLERDRLPRKDAAPALVPVAPLAPKGMLK